MIKLRLYNGQAIWLHPEAIARIVEADASSQWHGIRSIVTTFDKKLFELNESAERVADLIEQARKEAK
jgi:hypothetical protein